MLRGEWGLCIFEVLIVGVLVVLILGVRLVKQSLTWLSWCGVVVVVGSSVLVPVDWDRVGVQKCSGFRYGLLWL